MRVDPGAEAHQVSIHAPLRGATTWSLVVLPHTRKFQSTHPCGVRRDFRLQIRVVVGVSIHAPLRGATTVAPHIRICRKVSIHAPLRGATYYYRTHSSSSSSFNPRTPAGCDWPGCEHGRGADVSIHAPLRGATVHTFCRLPQRSMFQSTHPCGVRPPIRQL